MAEISEIGVRRDFLYFATAGPGVIASGVAIWPLVNQMNPSADAKALLSIKVDISGMDPGTQLTVKWRGKPVWILRRTDQNLKQLARSSHLENLRHPDSLIDNQSDYARNHFRSLREDIFVTVGICTHLGCVPAYLSNDSSTSDGAIYFCPCHGSKFDLAGRVFKNVPAPTNLIIPPYQFIDSDTIEIGATNNSG